ncbi:MAG TPA: BrnT family toxin [Terracidiphilus sp.]|jgi:hypothetical protein|nr:BrnT family toxin [Terracidiphilus sp.]
MLNETLEFDWDAANLNHTARHEVTQDEAEQAIRGDPLDIEMQIADGGDGEERLLQLGETVNGRVLQLLTTWRRGKVRVISAWDAPKQLKTYYLAEMRRRHGNSEDSEVRE